MNALCFASATEIAAHIRAGKISALECLEYFRHRVDAFNPRLNALVVLDWERARKRAAAADRAQARGASWGPLHGVPITVKESFDLAAHPTTWGDPALAANVAQQDDLAVQRLESAGAIVFGKTNVPLRLMDLQSYNAIYGATINPWDATRGPGGSSGGSAAALAAGLTALELGSDIGGSIRNPAHYCGVFGHKPTFGLVGATRNGPPGTLGATDMAVSGPLARSAEDLALSMHYLAAPGPFEASVWHASLRRPNKPLSDFRVSVWCDEPGFDVDSEIVDRCQSVALQLARLGATISHHARPDFAPAHSDALFRKLLNAAVDPFDELTHYEWRMLDNERMQLRLAWREFFRTWDVVLAPVAATPAFEHDHDPISDRVLQVNGNAIPFSQQLFWAGLASVSYLPGTAFPAGTSRSGLPIGLQVIADAYDDLLTIDFARQLVAEIGGFTPPPGYGD